MGRFGSWFKKPTKFAKIWWDSTGLNFQNVVEIRENSVKLGGNLAKIIKIRYKPAVRPPPVF
jgi:hypothetical protein